MNKLPSPEQTASYIKRSVIGSLLIEYATMELTGHFEFKHRCNILIAKCRDVQRYLFGHRNAGPDQRQSFKNEFLKDNGVLMGELVELCWDLNGDDLQTIIDQIKSNIDGTNGNPESEGVREPEI